METRASYILVGICVLGLLGAGVAIALWLARPQVETALYYMARFDEDVTGLRTGGDVRFHGVRVGEVASIRIDAETEQIEVKLQVAPYLRLRTLTVGVRAADHQQGDSESGHGRVPLAPPDGDYRV